MEISGQAKKMSEDNSLTEEQNQAYIELVGEEYATAEQAEEAYSGEFASDAEFAEDMAEQSGYLNDKQWPFYCIDWVWAGRELMNDYSEQDGFYFRNL
jgi:antirestriction protein